MPPLPAPAAPAAASAAPAENLTAKTFRGVQWSYASSIAIMLLQVGCTAVMARLLAPADFGLMAMAGVVLSFGNYFARMGIGSALVQKDTLVRAEVHAAFLLSVGFSLLTAVATWAGAPAVAALFDEPAVVPLVRVLALSFVLTGLSISAYHLLLRNLDFRAVAVADVLSYVLGYGVVGIGMAYAGYGVWSLVGAVLGMRLVLATAAHAMTRHGLSLASEWEHYRPLFSFGSRVSVVSFFEYLGATLDTLVVGRWMGAASLGFYTRGQMLVRMPMTQLTSSLSRVLLSSFSRVQSEVGRLRKAFLTTIELVGAALVPTCVGLAVCAEEAVLLMLGPQWTEAVPVLQILAFATALELFIHFCGVTCEATATLNVKVVIQLVFVALLGALFVALRPLGLAGFALAVLAAQAVRYGAYLVVVKRLLVIRPRKLLRAHLPALVNSVMIGGALYGLAGAVRAAALPVVVSFGAELVAGALLLAALLLFSPAGDVRREISVVLQRIDTPFGRRAARLLAWASHLAPGGGAPPA